MARPTTVLLEPAHLAALFAAWDLWAKIQDGRLTAVEVTAKRAPAKSYSGGTSQILKHYAPDGSHVCTTHRIVDRSGSVGHWDEADVKVGGLTIAKATSIPETA